MATKKMGRPTDSPKVISLKLRFDKETYEKLEKCSERMGVTRAELIRRCVRSLYDALEKQ